MRKFFAGLGVSLMIFANLGFVVLADDDGGLEQLDRGTVLPVNSEGFDTIDKCKELMDFVNYDPEYARGVFTEGNEISILGSDAGEGDILACGIRTGTIKLWMVPYYVRYILEFVIQLAGLVSVLGIIYGGYVYLFVGFGEEKDKGKKALAYSVGGMIVSLLAWGVVNILISLFTS